VAYYADGITIQTDDESHIGRRIRATTTHTTRTIQLYVSGLLVGARRPYDGQVQFELEGISATDVIFLLAVDHANADTDYWESAFPTAAANGDRIKFRIWQQGIVYMPDDVLKLYRGDAGDGSATILIHRQQLFPGGRFCCGYGFGYGDSYGYDGDNAPGYGHNYGYYYGFGMHFIDWQTEPLPPGVYPVKAVIEDKHGNASTAWTDNITLTTFARPARALAVGSYTKATDTLVLTFTGSEDITA